MGLYDIAIAKKLSSSSVEDGAIVTSKLASSAVTTPKIADGAITDAKLASNGIKTEVAALKTDLSDFTVVSYSKNRFDINAITSGYYLGSDGSLIAHASWHVSDYCFVKGFTTINCSNLGSGDTRYAKTMFYLCTYDENKRFIEQIGSMPSNPVTLGSNVAYVRFALNGTPSAEEKIQLESGTSITTFEEYSRTVKVVKENAPVEIVDVISYQPVTLQMTGNKLLNASNGVITDSSGHDDWQVSDYVEIEPNSKVMVTTQHFFGQGLYAFYDNNHVFISGLASNNENARTRIYNKIVSTPANAKYIVIGFLLESGTFDAPYLFEGVKQNVSPSQIWSNKKWTCVGDSLTHYNARTSIRYFDYVSARTGIQIYNMGFSGCGYAQGNDKFMTRISDVPTDSDVVTIFGSGNDGSAGLPLGTASDTGTDTLGGCINTTIDRLYEIMPVVQLGIVTPTPWANNMPSDNGWMENYANLIVEICRLRSIPCLDLFHCSNLNPNSAEVRSQAYSKDGGNGVHPDEVGHKVIASRIKGFLETLLI